jgi:hypothetical protein
MRKWLIFLLPVLIASCKKDNASGPMQGIWVEKNLRLDTVEFNNVFTGSSFKLRSAAYWDLSQNPTYPINHSSIYHYEIYQDTIKLNSINSSYSGLFAYKFNLNTSSSFIIGKFYSRTALPAILEFERIR